MRQYDIEVTRDGRWWEIRIPELDGVTQARSRGEIEGMARDYIALATDTPIAEVSVQICAGAAGSSSGLFPLR